jgi:hypothetical protein
MIKGAEKKGRGGFRKKVFFSCEYERAFFSPETTPLIRKEKYATF